MAIRGAILGDILGSQYEFMRPANLDYVNMKMGINEAKYPVEKAKGKALKYDQL